MISDQQAIFENKYFSYAYNLLGFETRLDFTIYFGIFMVIYFILRAATNLVFSYRINRFSSSISAYISTKLFRKYLNLNYPSFVNHNISHMAKLAITETPNISYLIVGVLQLVSEIVLTVFIYSLLLIINWKTTLIISILLGILSVTFYHFFILRTKKEGHNRSNALKKMHNTLNSSLNNFKMIKTISNQNQISAEYRVEADTYAKANTIHHSFSTFPKYILESISFVFLIISLLCLLVIHKGEIQQFLPIIFLFLLALYRLLPAVTKILASVNNIQYLSPILDNVVEDSHLPEEEYQAEPIDFSFNIEIKDLLFNYGDKTILNKVSISLLKNEKIAIVGKSGAGKSTVINILIGLLTDYQGEILIDGTPLTPKNILSFRKKVGYIPQDVYLFDDSVANNVAFGRQYEADKITMALMKANILNDLNDKEGLNTRVGDGGGKLSGGQRQRIGIARALYGDPEIIIMDEGTSALDLEVEKKIMSELLEISDNLTLIIVTHRLESIRNCDRIFQLSNEGVKDIKGEY
jgi:ABC-type multidrug transport system fused ATPase/permease subunit